MHRHKTKTDSVRDTLTSYMFIVNQSGIANFVGYVHCCVTDTDLVAIKEEKVLQK
jgi:hypothetical protein